MPEGEPRHFDMEPAEDEHPHEVDERVHEGKAEDHDKPDPEKKIDAVDGFTEEELEEGAKEKE